MSFLSGILGTRKAGNIINNAAQGAAGDVNAATAAGQGDVNNALGSNASNVNAAGAAATGDVNAATGAANNTLGNTLTGSGQTFSPYMQAGAAGIGSLQNYALSNPTFTAPTAAQAAATPGEQFAMQQGTQAINNSASAQGLANSGSTLKALTEFGQNLGSTYYQQAFNNAQSTFQQNQNNTLANLSALTGTGLNAAGQYNTSALNVGSQQAQNTLGAGLYAGNTSQNLAQFLASQNLQGNEYNSSLGQTGATTAGNFTMGGAQGLAAGEMGGANFLGGALNAFAGAAGKALASSSQSGGGSGS